MKTLEILLKPALTRTDIEYLEGVSEARAKQIMQACRKLGGGIAYNNRKITTKSYFELNNEDYYKWLSGVTGGYKHE